MFIITHNKTNVNIKSDKKYIKIKYTENSENNKRYKIYKIENAGYNRWRIKWQGE